jgi:hypothetical protein
MHEANVSAGELTQTQCGCQRFTEGDCKTGKRRLESAQVKRHLLADWRHVGDGHLAHGQSEPRANRALLRDLTRPIPREQPDVRDFVAGDH